MIRWQRKRLTVLLPLVLLVLIQFIRPARENPPVRPGADMIERLSPPVSVVDLLRTSCYDCHSHRTRWPWYSRVAPVSWMVAHDVEEARDHLDFSSWDRYTEAAALAKLQDAYSELKEGKMPLRIYLLAHPQARPRSAQVEALGAWVRKLSGPAISADPGSGPAETERDRESRAESESQ